MTKLTEDEFERYDRHLKLADFGLEKQIKLKNAKVLLVGAGGLGCPIALYLAASGVGNITIVDDDKIELSNLQRQIAFSGAEIGQFKAKVLAQKMRELNPAIQVIDITKRIEAKNIEQLIGGYDLVIDGTDNFASRFLIADSCYFSKISYLHAAVHQYQGQVSLFVPGKTACFRCLYRQPPSAAALPPCEEAGILGVVTGTIGLMVATEAVKYLTGLGESIAGKVLTYNTLKQELKKFVIERDANCPLCSKNANITKIQEYNYIAQDETNCIQRMEMSEQVMTIARATALMQCNDAETELVLLDVREQKEYEQGHLENANLWPLSILRALPKLAIATELKSHLSLKNSTSNKEQIIICYCQRGTRSLKAVSLLREADIANVFSLDGGLEAWYPEQQKSLSKL